MVKVNCVHCGEKVSEWTVECPDCGKPVANPHAPINVSNYNWSPNRGKQYKKKNSLLFTIIGILSILVIVVIIYYLKL